MGDVVTALARAVQEQGRSEPWTLGSELRCPWPRRWATMGDVATALARAVKEAGHHVLVVIPKDNYLDYTEARAHSSEVS